MDKTDVISSTLEFRVLGSVFDKLSLIDTYKLTGNDFKFDNNNLGFQIAYAMYNKGATSVNYVDVASFLLEYLPDLYKKYEKRDIPRLIENCNFLKNTETLNADVEELKKWTLLRKLFKLGYDISPFCPADAASYEESITIRKKLNETSLQGIVNYYKTELDAIDIVDFSQFDPFKGYNYLDIPGVNDQTEWIVQDCFQGKTFQIIAGPAKSGKSQLAYQLAYCLSNGIDFLGKEVKQKKVLYVDWELSAGEIKHRMDLLNEFFKVEEPETPVFVPLYRTNYSLKDIVEGVKQALKNNPEVDVIVYDNLYSFFDGDLNSSSEVKKALKAIQSVSDTATIFLVCHTTKADGKNSGSDNPIYAAAGSNAFAGFADEFVNIENKVDGRTVKITGRHVYPVQEFNCRFDNDTKWQFAPIDEGETLKEWADYVRPREELEQEYPELSRIIGEDGASLVKINKIFPEETVTSLKEKGFPYSGRNASKIREGFKTKKFYLEKPW